MSANKQQKIGKHNEAGVVHTIELTGKATAQQKNDKVEQPCDGVCWHASTAAELLIGAPSKASQLPMICQKSPI